MYGSVIVKTKSDMDKSWIPAYCEDMRKRPAHSSSHPFRHCICDRHQARPLLKDPEAGTKIVPRPDVSCTNIRSIKQVIITIESIVCDKIDRYSSEGVMKIH